ncbi:hypothetical protein F5Y18DRAFT_36624 [Xylariaceae sp. FL1019]|nr:hypothetical protein F5Y18DRAFT_36624 [Xylariaceae sp. FL1019]
MKFTTSSAMAVMVGVASARPDILVSGSIKGKREVPQEHSHEQFLTGVGDALNLNNVDQVQDPVFALLGNAAAAAGAGLVTDLDCLQQRVADQAFTNAKAASDVEGMTNALIFRALERNTGSVGLASVLCTETAVNPEIAAISQHQDPASDNAAETNKAITLALAQQLASIGADPQLALKAGTFAPGEVGDPTAAGNTCDVDTDPVGCIFSQNLLVEDATADEIDAAVAGGASATPVASDPASSTDDGCAASDTAAADAPAASNGTAVATPASASNVNVFTGTLGAAPVPVTSDAASDRPFTVNGDTFVNAGAALQRACAVQNNACANAANSGEIDASVGDCNAQEQDCNSANSGVAKRGVAGLRARQNAHSRSLLPLPTRQFLNTGRR